MSVVVMVVVVVGSSRGAVDIVVHVLVVQVLVVSHLLVFEIAVVADLVVVVSLPFHEEEC